MKSIRLIRLLFSAILASTFYCAQAQSDSSRVDLMDLSLEQLANVRIVSASRKEENLFDAPVSSFVITRNDIMNSGATSIPEALRLAPALIVREVANGSYDVSIRGGKDNLASHQFWNSNTSILAMVNNQVIFNYYYGGTYWQSLPVDVADIERIEIVYGPNSPLYGPNAVDGVINIITRKRTKETETYGNASVQAGENLLFSALGGKRISEKLEVNVSANHTNRKRMKAEYYDPATDTFITDLLEHSDPAVSSDPNTFYPNGDLGSRHTGLNFNLYYTPGKKTTFSFNSAYNESLGLVGSTYGSIFQHMSNTSLSNLFRAEAYNFTFQTSIIRGRLGTRGSISEYNYEYTTWDNYLDYNLKINNKLSLRPSVSYQKAIIDDEAYTVQVRRTGLFNNKAFMYNYAFSLKADYSPIKSLRIIGAVRADKFKAPDDTYISYQGIVNYKFNRNNMLRFLAGRSIAGSFIEPTYLNLTVVDNPFIKMTILGNESRELLQNDILELGYRMQLGKKLTFDFTVFSQTYSNFAAPVTEVVKDPAFAPPQQGEMEVRFQNIDLESWQKGATLTATFLLGKVKFQPSITCQKTALKNYTPYYHEPHPFFAPENNIEKVTAKESEYAPDFFGGFSLNIPARKWNFNLSGYFYNKYRQDGLNSLDLQNGELAQKSIENIQGKFLANVNIGYTISPQVRTFLNARNISGQTSREGYGTDRIGLLLFAGINIEF